MTTRKRVAVLLIGVPLLAVATAFGVRNYRIARSAAFCDAVEALPRAELEHYAARCDQLMFEGDASQEGPRFVTDTNILAQFTLARSGFTRLVT